MKHKYLPGCLEGTGFGVLLALLQQQHGGPMGTELSALTDEAPPLFSTEPKSDMLWGRSEAML